MCSLPSLVILMEITHKSPCFEEHQVPGEMLGLWGVIALGVKMELCYLVCVAPGKFLNLIKAQPLLGERGVIVTSAKACDSCHSERF